MQTDKTGADLRRRVAKDLRIKGVPDAVWRLLVKDGYVRDVQKFSHEYPDLKKRVRQLLKMVSDVRGYAPPTAWTTRTIDDAFTPYVRLRTQTTSEPLPPPYEDWQVVAITCGISSGRIVVGAEPWVPAKSVEQCYRELQQLVFDGKPNRPLKEKTLKLYGWVTARHRDREETWRETMHAWNRNHRRWRYTQVTNFHRDYHRVQRSIEGIRDRTLALQRELGS